MSDFDVLQAALTRTAAERRAEQQACEALLNGLYHALRRASGPGLPLNNVMLDLLPDPAGKLRPPPAGAFHAAWLRLGVCEVLVRVRWTGAAFHGEFAEAGTFHLDDLTEDALTILARRLLREVTAAYTGPTGPQLPTLN